MSYLDEISGGGYYLNAFNNLLKKRQLANEMAMQSQPQMQNEMMMGGGSERAPTAFDNMSNAEKAAYYSNNPTMAAITQGLQKGFGMTSYGMLQNALVPDFVREQGMVARGIDPGIGVQGQGTTGQTGLYGDQFAGMPAPKSSGFMDTLGRMFGGSSVSLNPAPVEDRAASLTPTGMAAAAPGVAEANAAGYDSGMGNFGGGSNSFGEGQYNQGGMVHAQHLMGRAPAPDDGYGALQGGEYVITKAAVEKYGKAMMDAINNGTFR